MLRIAMSLSLAAIPLMTDAASAAAPVPCETMLQRLDDALKSTKPAPDAKAKIAALRDKGLERCKADDDARANAFLRDALKLLGK